MSNTTTKQTDGAAPVQAARKESALSGRRQSNEAGPTQPAKAIIRNRGFGLPNVGDTVLLDGEGLTDAIHIRRIISVAEPSRAHDGTLWQSVIVEGSVLRVVAAEDCVSEYVATARLLPGDAIRETAGMRAKLTAQAKRVRDCAPAGAFGPEIGGAK